MTSGAPKTDAGREHRANQEIVRVLEASKALSENIIDELPVVMMMVDDQRQVLKLNREGQRVFGHDEAAVLGCDVTQILPEPMIARVDEYFAAFDRPEQRRVIFEAEFPVNGNKAYYYWQICPVYRDKSSHHEVMIFIGNDITDARASLEKLVELRKDLEVAGAVQSMLLPPSLTKTGPFFRMAGHYEPSAQVGGDLWWYLAIPGLGLLSVVGDAMGHGAGSALAAATLAGALNALVHHHELRSGEDVLRLLRDINRTISVTYQDKYMVSLGCIWLNETRETVEVSGGGFPPMLMQPATGASSSLFVRGDPLGLGISTFKIETKEVPMRPGDRLVCFTDGCYEFLCDGEPFRRQQLVKVFDKVRGLPPESACLAVSKTLREIRGREFAEDDMTFVMIDRL